MNADVCIVGAGIVGLAHADDARRRGLRVVVVEREHFAVGASVRNFGHLIFSGLADGEGFDCALRSRERWLALGAEGAVQVRETGSVIVARADDELAVLESVAADAARHARMLTPAEVASLLPIPTRQVLGGLQCALDLRVDPRTAVAALAAQLSDDPAVRIEWGAQVHEIEPGRVHTAAFTVDAPNIVICPGPDYRALPPSVRPGLEPLTLCQLQMQRVAAPLGRHYGPAMVTGLSLIRYPAFANRPVTDALRARLEAERAELIDAGVHLLITQLPDGDLVIGDSHAYGDTLAPFAVERVNELLLAEACALLGAPRLEVRERWRGIYPTAKDGRLFLVTAPLPGVRVVENISGLGMTLSFGQAPLVLDELLAQSWSLPSRHRPAWF